jgi:hypothetical protein
MMSMHAGIHRLENVGMAPHCTNRLYAALTSRPYRITFLLWATIERINAILTCLASRCTVWAKSGGDAQVDPDRVPQSLD